MSLSNIDRDAFIIQSLLLSRRVTFSSANNNYNSDGVVYTEYASMESSANSSAAGCIGVNMRAPVAEFVPFRVKARMVGESRLMIGYGPSTITGTNDAISEQLFVKFTDYLDEIYMVPYEASISEQLVFALGATASGQGGQISVQNLGVAPMSYEKGVS
jgi:hypothetical protein